jgi:hypothetical protein
MKLLRYNLFFLLMSLPSLYAADFYQVNSGTSLQITEYSVCKDVVNHAAQGVFVPTKTAGEWSSFYTNPPTGSTAASCEDNWYNASWGYRVKLTIDHTKVAETLTNFPVLITESNLPAGFWTHVNASGSDIVVTSEDGTTKLDRELVAISTGSQTMELHVRIPTVENLDPTVVFLYYGNAGATETNAATTWSAYRNIYHMTATTPTDSTGTTTTTGASGGTLGAAKLGDGLDFSGTGKVDFSSTITTAKTLSLWYYPRTNGGGNYGSVFGSNDYNHGIRHVGGNPMVFRRSGAAIVSTSGTFNVWKHLVFSYNSGTGQITLIENGVAGSPATTTMYTIYHLVSISGATNRAPDGKVDEMRVSNNTLSAGWALTEYNNQNSPATFYSASAEIPKP